MNKLFELTSESSALPLTTINSIKYYTIEHHLNTFPDTDLISHNKHMDKEYFIESEISLHDEYPILLDASLVEYGFSFEDELLDDLEDGRYIKYKIHQIDQRFSVIRMRGILSGSYAEIDADARCKLVIRAISKSDYKNLELHESLAIDAYLLEIEANYKMAFFTYFTAIESIVRLKTDKIKSETYKELGHAIEHLSLKEKIKVSGKHTFPEIEISKVAIWGAFTDLVTTCSAARNDIAHALKPKEFTRVDVEQVAACYMLTQQVLLNKLQSMEEVTKVYTPEKNKSVR
ncbi:hypothetical protein [Pseudomonas frederiksbergensis]|uniref:hypothetical protein n=1 Tax=Pseudomonas frederiksbergensis TaxID=104087 RepID=UPI003D1B6FA8